MVQLRASATKDRAAARDAAESLRRARLDLDRAVAARKDAEADAASSRADADDARKASETRTAAPVALEAKCRDLGATDVDITAARVPEGRSWRRSGRTAGCVAWRVPWSCCWTPRHCASASVSARSACWP